MRSTDLFSIFLPKQWIILRLRSTSQLSILRANFLFLIRGHTFKFNGSVSAPMGPSESQIGTTGWICPNFLFLGRRMEERSLKTEGQ
jgi:hypothetical protein